MNRRPRSATSRPSDAALLYRITSILLRYPDHDVRGLLDQITAALPALPESAVRGRIAEVARWLCATPTTRAAEHYVATFDHTRRRSLHLTYYRHGDTRARGMALLAINHTYREAGYAPPEGELPDFLPLVLEFASAAPEPGERVLIENRAGLELLTDAVHEADSPYAELLDVVRDRLPELGPRLRDELRALAANGPPSERVGLEPFAPPEYVTGERR
jgi:nitrate reductase delta subunit